MPPPPLVGREGLSLGRGNRLSANRFGWAVAEDKDLACVIDASRTSGPPQDQRPSD